MRPGPLYTRYLEILVTALLDEREAAGKTDDIVAPNATDGSPGHYCPILIREAIKRRREEYPDGT